MAANGYQSAYDGNAALKMAAPAEPAQQNRPPEQQKKAPPKQSSAKAQAKKAQAKPKHRAGAKFQLGSKPRWAGKTAPTAMAAIFAVAAVVVVTLISYANLVMINDQAVTLRSTLNDLKTEETKLMAQYELAYDLQEIEAQMLASGQMTKIQNWQTYTLELSEPDSVEYYQGSDFREQIVSFAKNLVSAVKEYF